jgi:hypothetical protein
MGDDLDGLFGETKDECLEAIAQAVVQGNMQLAEGGVRVLVENYKLGLADIRKQFIGKKGHVRKRVHSAPDQICQQSSGRRTGFGYIQALEQASGGCGNILRPPHGLLPSFFKTFKLCLCDGPLRHIFARHR